MIERFLEEWRRTTALGKATEPSEAGEKLRSKSGRNESILDVIPTIKKIVRRKLYFAEQREAPDIIQKVVLQLLIWRDNQSEKSEEMTADEWQSFASKTAYNAVKRHLSGNRIVTDPLDEAAEISGEKSVAGNTVAEVASLLRPFWQEICRLSLRQRCALLLGSEMLIVILKKNGIGNRELCNILDLDESALFEIYRRLPLSDAQIALLFLEGENNENRNIDSLTGSIKKARHEARAKLKKIISE